MRNKGEKEQEPKKETANDQKDKKKGDQPLGTKIVDELLKYEQETYQIKRPFLKAQYHQCIPNPKISGELVSVQICSMWSLGFIEPELPLSQMDKPSHLIAPYTSQKIQKDDHMKLQSQITLSEDKERLDIREKDNENTIGKANDAETIEF